MAVFCMKFLELFRGWGMKSSRVCGVWGKCTSSIEVRRYSFWYYNIGCNSHDFTTIQLIAGNCRFLGGFRMHILVWNRK